MSLFILKLQLYHSADNTRGTRNISTMSESLQAASKELRKEGEIRSVKAASSLSTGEWALHAHTWKNKSITYKVG